MSCGVVAELLCGVVELSWSCCRVVMRLSWSCRDVIVELSWCYRGVVAMLSWSCREVIVELSWGYRGVVVRLSWGCREVIVELSWGYREVVVELSWSGHRGRTVAVEWTDDWEVTEEELLEATKRMASRDVVPRPDGILGRITRVGRPSWSFSR